MQWCSTNPTGFGTRKSLVSPRLFSFVKLRKPQNSLLQEAQWVSTHLRSYWTSKVLVFYMSPLTPKFCYSKICNSTVQILSLPWVTKYWGIYRHSYPLHSLSLELFVKLSPSFVSLGQKLSTKIVHFQLLQQCSWLWNRQKSDFRDKPNYLWFLSVSLQHFFSREKAKKTT